MIFDLKNQKYVQVRSPRGGGVRNVEVVEQTSYREMIEMGKVLFFPDGIYENFDSFSMIYTCSMVPHPSRRFKWDNILTSLIP